MNTYRFVTNYIYMYMYAHKDVSLSLCIYMHIYYIMSYIQKIGSPFGSKAEGGNMADEARENTINSTPYSMQLKYDRLISQALTNIILCSKH